MCGFRKFFGGGGGGSSWGIILGKFIWFICIWIVWNFWGGGLDFLDLCIYVSSMVKIKMVM